MNAWNVKIKQIDDTNNMPGTKQSNQWQQMYDCIKAKFTKEKSILSKCRIKGKSNHTSLAFPKNIRPM